MQQDQNKNNDNRQIISQTDTTVLNPVISQKVEGGQIHLNDVTV